MVFSFTPKLVTLFNVLYVPAIKKNLINVARLVIENGVLIEFVDNLYLIKDRDTKKLLIQRSFLSKGSLETVV